MNKHPVARIVVAAALLGSLASPALADQGIIRDKRAFPKLNCGESFVLGARQKQVPAEAAPVEKPKTLSEAQIAEVMKSHLEDVHYCWNRLPAKLRAQDASVMLSLSIAPKGDVLDTTTRGDAPSEAKACLAAAARRWAFPAAQIASEIEYPVAMHSVATR